MLRYAPFRHITVVLEDTLALNRSSVSCCVVCMDISDHLPYYCFLFVETTPFVTTSIGSVSFCENFNIHSTDKVAQSYPSSESVSRKANLIYGTKRFQDRVRSENIWIP